MLVISCRSPQLEGILSWLINVLDNARTHLIHSPTPKWLSKREEYPGEEEVESLTDEDVLPLCYHDDKMMSEHLMLHVY